MHTEGELVSLADKSMAVRRSLPLAFLTGEIGSGVISGLTSRWGEDMVIEAGAVVFGLQWNDNDISGTSSQEYKLLVGEA